MTFKRFYFTYFGSGGPSDNGFMDNLQRLRNTKNASFCSMCANAPATGSEPSVQLSRPSSDMRLLLEPE